MFNGAGGVSGLAACLKRISIVAWVDVAHHLSPQAMLGWVSAAKLMGSRKGGSKVFPRGMRKPQMPCKRVQPLPG